MASEFADPCTGESCNSDVGYSRGNNIRARPARKMRREAARVGRTASDDTERARGTRVHASSRPAVCALKKVLCAQPTASAHVRTLFAAAVAHRSTVAATNMSDYQTN
ncbi:unnamed protein product, partial [Iphiclides podalirius]